MSKYLDKLVRVTFVNWYLFSAEDIELSPSSTLFRGQNGVGKSSILDGIQTCIAGADENLISMNAASSNGKSSGRTVRSYVLGEVAESTTHAASEPRSESNSYIALTFKKKNDSGYYSFGVALHARINHTEVTKKHFALDGGDIKADDFMLEADQVITWKTFEQRLRAGHGKYLPANTARDYRNICASLMSAPGASNQISSLAMFRAIRSGLIFKERDSMSEFCRDYILPEQSIDVNRIENDYENLTKIQQTIAEALKRLKELKAINKTLKEYETNKIKEWSFKWAGKEAKIISLDTEKNRCEDNLKNNNDQLVKANLNFKELDEILPMLKKQRDDAYAEFINSDYAGAVKRCEDEINKQDSIQSENLKSLAITRNLISKLIDEKVPLYINELLSSDLNKAIDALCLATGSSLGMLNINWPKDDSEISDAENALLLFEGVTVDVNDQITELRVNKKLLSEQVELKQHSLNNLTDGKASLNSSTLALIDALDAEGIKSSPVCDLAEVVDKSWQKGIEHFLGNNREALVVLDDHREEAPADLIERAISIYRVIKKTNPSVRRAKLINPEKILATPDLQADGYAAGLIKANHPTAERYLRAQLKNLELVETESELRKSKRAITRDGMVSANGTISGGNKIDFVLLGKQARIDGTTYLIKEIKSIKEEIEEIDQKIQELSLIEGRLTGVIDLKRQCSELYNTLESFQKVSECKEDLKKSLDHLKKTTDSNLQTRYEDLDERLGDTTKRMQDFENESNHLKRNIKELNTKFNGYKKLRDEAVEERKVIEGNDRYSAEEACHCLETLQSTFGDDNLEVIIKTAQIEADSHLSKAQDKLDKGKARAVAYAGEYNVPDRREFIELTDTELQNRCIEHAERIERSDIIRYENEADIARDNMNKGFRSDVVAKLKENFQKVESTFKDLNNALKDIVFNGNTYKFRYPLIENPTLKRIHKYATSTSDIELSDPNGLFSTPEDHPVLEVITKTLEEGRLMDLSDYRVFYNYDLEATSVATGTKRGFRELVSKGSGGEKGTPYYVALGAAFMTAFKIRIAGSQALGGAAIAIFDEAFSKIDGSNSKAALKFFEDIGLQVILAAPPESEAKIGPYVEGNFNVIRSAEAIYLDPKQYKEKAREVLQSDDPSVNKHLVDERVKEMEAG